MSGKGLSVVRRADASISALSTQLQQLVPDCVQSCLASYIDTEFDCKSNNETCLCSSYGSHGLTLGELALGCLSVNCQDATQSEKLAQYNICASIAGAVRPTQTIVSLPAATPTSTSEGVTTTSLKISATALASMSSATPHNTLVSSNSIASTTDTSPSAASSAEAISHVTSAPAPATTTKEATNLTSAQAVGVSIGAFSAMISAAIVVYLILWWRKRRAMRTPKMAEPSFNFVNGSPPRHSPFRHGFADPRGPLGGFSKPRVELDCDRSDSPKYGDMGQIIVHSDSREQLFPHRSVSQDNGKHQRHYRAISQLRPARPEPTLLRMSSNALLAGSSDPAATLLPPQNANVRTPRAPGAVGLPPRPNQQAKAVPRRPTRPDFTANFTTSPEEVKHPKLSLAIPTRASPSAQAMPLIPLLPPAPIEPASTVTVRMSPGPRNYSAHSVASGNSYLPTYYTSAESRTPPITPISPSIQVRRPVPATILVTKPTYPPLAMRSNSVRSSGGGSETSFECSEDDITPPLEQDGKRLSAVAESTSPASTVRYPPIPRPSNFAASQPPAHAMVSDTALRRTEQAQASPQRQHRHPSRILSMSTPQRVPTSTSQASSTLAAKRRGDGAAYDLEQGLNIDSLTHSLNNSQAGSQRACDDHQPQLPTQRTRHDSLLKGYGRQTTTPPGRAVGPRKPSYAGTGYGDMPQTPLLTTLSPGPRVIRTDREVLIRSPLWEPKLTPSRRGDDLYLDVSLGSPMKDSPATPGPRSALGHGSTAGWRP